MHVSKTWLRTFQRRWMCWNEIKNRKTKNLLSLLSKGGQKHPEEIFPSTLQINGFSAHKTVPPDEARKCDIWFHTTNIRKQCRRRWRISLLLLPQFFEKIVVKLHFLVCTGPQITARPEYRFCFLVICFLSKSVWTGLATVVCQRLWANMVGQRLGPVQVSMAKTLVTSIGINCRTVDGGPQTSHKWQSVLFIFVVVVE